VEQPNAQIIEISQAVDISRARQAARALAIRVGFDEKAREEVAIAVSELAANLLKHARQGRLTLTLLQEAARAGIQIESMDVGPGIADVERAMADGFSTAGSLGCGLGAVNRMMDEFEIAAPCPEGGGTRILCRRWVRASAPNLRSCPLDLGAATRACPGKEVNGDAFVIEPWNESVLVGVIDGVGHGPLAHQAAQAARKYVEDHAQQPLKVIFRGAGHACRATQGVAMALAGIEWAEGKLTFASVGNVEARLFGTPERVNFVVRRGVIGLNAPDPVVTDHPWQATSLLVLHSDGMHSRWRWEDFSHLQEAAATVLAQQMLERLARDNDDATVVVVKGERSVTGTAG
jgi:anti-sigma regulatory factor (Ser/Thr protein kinase)